MRFDVDAFAADHARPLTCVHRILDVEPDRYGSTLRCETLRIRRERRERYGTELETGVPLGAGPVATVRVDVITPAVLRFRFAAGEVVSDNAAPMLVSELPTEPEFELDIAADVRLRTSLLQVTLARAPYHAQVVDARGSSLLDTVGLGMPASDPALAGSGLGGMEEPWPWFLPELLPLGFVEDDARRSCQVFETSRLHHDEHVYGLGERFGPIDKRGQAVTLWQANAAGTHWPLSYKNVPFLLSTAGYGHFVNSVAPIAYHLGDRSHAHWSVQVQDQVLDYFLIAGPSFREILPRYTDLTGRPRLPPLWSFGLWVSRMGCETKAAVETVAERLRAERISSDVIQVDNGWWERPWINDLAFSTERFPDPAGMARRLGALGFRLGLWQFPYISTASALYEPGRAGGYFATGEDGEPLFIDGFFGPAAVVDFSDPEAVARYGQALQRLLHLGVSVIGTDFGEGAPPDANYHGGSGLALHNLYPLLYNKAVFEVTERTTGEGLVWSRSAYAGSQRYPLHWSGDPAACWEDLAADLRGGLGFGLCGFPFWSHDIGGFTGTPTPQLYVRWAQAGLFASHPRLHGSTGREPWRFGERALATFRADATLRYRLLPYVWSEAVRCVRQSQPLLRPLVLDWQDDPTTFTIGDQFLLGEHLLVVPVLDRLGRRRAYLPEGAWMDYWRGTVLHGPRWLELEAPLEELPIFLRAGAIIPMADPVPHSGMLDWDRLTLDIFPASSSRFVVVRDDLVETTVTCTDTAGWSQIELQPVPSVQRLRLRGIGGPCAATLDGRPVPRARVGGDLLVSADQPFHTCVVEKRTGAPP